MLLLDLNPTGGLSAPFQELHRAPCTQDQIICICDIWPWRPWILCFLYSIVMLAPIVFACPRPYSCGVVVANWGISAVAVVMWMLVGCVSQCKGNVVPHDSPKGIACCDDVDLCNEHIEPTILYRSTTFLPGSGFASVQFIICSEFSIDQSTSRESDKISFPLRAWCDSSVFQSLAELLWCSGTILELLSKIDSADGLDMWWNNRRAVIGLVGVVHRRVTFIIIFNARGSRCSTIRSASTKYRAYIQSRKKPNV